MPQEFLRQVIHGEPVLPSVERVRNEHRVVHRIHPDSVAGEYLHVVLDVVAHFKN